MQILIAGATGYVGRRLIPRLLEDGHSLTLLTRGEGRIAIPEHHKARVTILNADLREQAPHYPHAFDAAYFLVHSMHDTQDFAEVEKQTAQNFIKHLDAKQKIFLSGIANEKNLSPHIHSRLNVEKILAPCTVLRAGIIIGSGSASFEIIRDLVEKLPIMVAPKWVNNLCQPIAIHDVIHYLVHILGKEEAFNRTYDIGGPDILSYREMLLKLAEIRELKRIILNVPFFTPRLSSYWLYFITSVNFSLAQTLVDNLSTNFICENTDIQTLIPHQCLTYKEAVQRAFDKIAENTVISSWHDALISSDFSPSLQSYIEVPTQGCLIDHRTFPFQCNPEKVINKIWMIGGKTGWYANDPLWNIRGMLDRLFGGSGLRRGRTNPQHIHPGDALDFWRVLVADKEKKRLLLYAEMKLPGEAWLEFRIDDHTLHQIATFRPKGLLGRLYWYILLPFHTLIFPRMGRNIIKKATKS